MDIKRNNLSGEEHDQPPQDEATRNKIDKHLSDKEDTISEEDMKNINTSTGREHIPATSHRDPDEEDEIIEDKDDDNDDDEPKEEMPTAWDIKG